MGGIDVTEQSPSPLSDRFYTAVGIVAPMWRDLLVPELPVKASSGHLYRIDFGCVAWPPLKVAIELDGQDFHSQPIDVARDRRRQRELERDGWLFIRFGGSEVYNRADDCAAEALEFIVQAYNRMFSQAA